MAILNLLFKVSGNSRQLEQLTIIIPIVQPVTAALACIAVYIRTGGKIPGLKLSMHCKITHEPHIFFIR